MDPLTAIGPIERIEGQVGPAASGRATTSAFQQALTDAIQSVDGLQRRSEAVQTSFARGEEVELHDVLMRIEEADLAFRTMMEVRNKLVDAYREVMRLGSGG